MIPDDVSAVPEALRDAYRALLAAKEEANAAIEESKRVHSRSDDAQRTLFLAREHYRELFERWNPLTGELQIPAWERTDLCED